ncbi:hypothetical protein Cycma_1491 [Cyclobacterium marinum DSM 745]|uniref:Uncharacterized protein n=1 Tax=Cyclobacterium marinum (strain ATCC 25205 / DSM 745 / LMG 13164 / NCIMB 1802) TaxID=880070 RepID=G0J3P9_CYCMS|nr:hypothetical protein Cycma_1491 [Cyclobacterium marinum DSM 745]
MYESIALDWAIAMHGHNFIPMIKYYFFLRITQMGTKVTIIAHPMKNIRKGINK